MLAMDPNNGHVRQIVQSMTRQDWIDLGDICEGAVRAMDRRNAAVVAMDREAANAEAA